MASTASAKPVWPYADIDLRTGADIAEWISPPAGVKTWLDENAVEVSSDPDASLADLEPFRERLAGARILSLGETSHGTGDFFRFKHRLLRFCVTELGYTAFGIEAFPAECAVVDHHIKTGEGNASDAVALIYGGGYPWDVQEIVAMVEWMREYNSTASKQVSFYGFDIHYPRQSAIQVHRLLKGTSLLDEAEKLLRPVTVGTEADLDGLRRLSKSVDSGIVRYFLSGLINQLSPLPDKTPNHAVRDLRMAQNTLALLDVEGPDSKLVAWAHNGHVFREKFFKDAPAQGIHIDAALGDKQVVVGFAFDKGTFRAHNFYEGFRRENFNVDSAPSGSFDAALRPGPGDCFMVDLATARGEVAEWLEAPMPVRTLTAGHADDETFPAWLAFAPAKAYDLVAWFRNTTASTPISPDKARLSEPPVINESVENLDFTSGTDGWTVFGTSEGPLAYDFELSAGMAGFSRADIAWSGGGAGITQRVKANSFAGHTCRLKASASADGEFGSGASLMLVAFGAEAPSPMGGGQIASANTRVVGGVTEVDLAVPAQAQTIMFGFSVTGSGSFQVSEFSFEAVD